MVGVVNREVVVGGDRFLFKVVVRMVVGSAQIGG